MKIVIAAHNARVGGGITYLLNILKHLSLLDDISQITVYCNSRFRREVKLYNLRNPKINIINDKILDGNIFLRLLWFYFFLPYKLYKNRAEVFFSPGGTLPFCLPRAITKVVVCQNLQPFFSDIIKLENNIMTLQLTINRILLINSFKRADGIILLTEYARSILKKAIPNIDEKFVVTPHGVEAEYYNEPDKGKIKSAKMNNCYSLLYVSSLKSYKRHAELLGAIKKLIDKGNRNLKLFLVGSADKSIKRKTEGLINDYKLNGFVEYCGEVPLTMMPEIYKKSDIFVFPSVCESFALPLLEAMAAGMPIVASNYPPMNEILRDVAIYFDPNDEESIANGIEKVILDADLRYLLSVKAYGRAKQFLWEISVSKINNFIKRLQIEKSK